MKENIFIAIPFPEVQELMDKKGFTENASLINDGILYQEYGDSAYFVRQIWANSIYLTSKQEL